jgi:hypothetical protein
MKPLDALRALFEHGFRMAPAAVLSHGASVFRSTEVGAQPHRPALAKQKERDDARDQNHGEGNDYGHFCCAYRCEIHMFLGLPGA